VTETETEERVAGRAAGRRGTGWIAGGATLAVGGAPTVDDERHQLQLKTPRCRYLQPSTNNVKHVVEMLQIKRAEYVQKVFTKILTGMTYLSYEERLSVLNLESLEV